jgi:hypothetical protein
MATTKDTLPKRRFARPDDCVTLVIDTSRLQCTAAIRAARVQWSSKACAGRSWPQVFLRVHSMRGSTQVAGLATRLAAQAAHRVHGVLDVANDINVKIPGSA